jgi:hypothetical protein
LVTNAEWILTKQLIIQKVYELFAGQIDVIKNELTAAKVQLPLSAASSEPKIFKGENYQQLPYVMMDYPRLFNGSNVFAIRTMFWWGHFFSITLHIAGEHRNAVMESILAKKNLLYNAFYIGVNEDQWQHHFEENNFISVKEAGTDILNKSILGKDFIKLALKYELEQWNQLPSLLAEGYREIAKLLA